VRSTLVLVRSALVLERAEFDSVNLSLVLVSSATCRSNSVSRSLVALSKVLPVVVVVVVVVEAGPGV